MDRRKEETKTQGKNILTCTKYKEHSKRMNEEIWLNDRILRGPKIRNRQEKGKKKKEATISHVWWEKATQDVRGGKTQEEKSTGRQYDGLSKLEDNC